MPAVRRAILVGTACLAALSIASKSAGAQLPAQMPMHGGRGGGQNHVKPPPPIDSSAVPKPEQKMGCAVFDVRLNAGTFVTVARAAGAPRCGPIDPILVGQPVFDSVNRVVTMPIALVNRGIDRLHAPIALVAGRAALVVTSGAPVVRVDSPAAVPVKPPSPTPPPLVPSPAPTPNAAPGTVVLVGGANPFGAAPASTAPSNGPGLPARPVDALHFVGAETLPLIDSTGAESPAVRWSFEKLLARPGHDPVTADDGTIELRAGDTTAARTVTVSVPKGVTGFNVGLEGTGTYVFTVPFRASETIPRDEQEDSRAPDNILTDVPGLPGRVVRNKLWVMFRPDASPEQRQAAVDSVDAVVVGGMLRGTDRYYYLRITANPDSGAAPLERALRTLAPMAQVQDVMPDRLP